MEKETLIQNLKEKVGEDNRKIISDKTFDGVAESVLSMFEDDEKITDDTWKLPVATLNQFAGQKRFDEKNFAEKFKTDYEAQHMKEVEERIRVATEKAIEDYKKEHDGVQPPKKEDESIGIDDKIAAAVAKAFDGLTGKDGAIGKSLDTINAFIASQSEREKNDMRNRVRADLKKHLVELKANNEACIDDALDDIEYGENPTFDGLKQSAIDAYEKRYKRYYADGGKPFGGDSTGGGSGSNSFVKEKLDRLKKEAEESRNYAEQISKDFV